MEKKYFVNPVEFTAAMCTVIVSAVISCSLVYIRRPVSALVFFLIALLFLKVSFTTGAKITINPDRITRSVLGKTTISFTWDEISEVGVAGSRIFNKGNKEKSGTLYIYFSKTPMTDEERFQMMLKWPPKDKIYLEHDKYRMDFIQTMYGKKVQKYNTGSLKI
ncbi:hypothetical protein GPL15_12575 [Clostridium sp. MCC353]|uniref:hypothetical protein n=1 Tax=Clostridium sp. MCC353 TaxID=2592646 RepID=UPI001C00C51B|nr:hypothetical protein [Clostridium sp. MCC353]MBT9777339.1 hypothetical protein [Clostridium sp. MCC353]